jgi:ABC-type branched-subunit amino acid transport system substrate-binding protein
VHVAPTANAHGRARGIDHGTRGRVDDLGVEFVAGKRIELIVKDDTGLAPETTKRIAQELVVQDKVSVLAGFGLTPLALAAVAAGADGLIVEVHPDPTCAKSDGEQSLTFDVFGEMMRQVQAVARAVGRDCAVSSWREAVRA